MPRNPYPSTKHFAETNDPRPHSDYAGGYLDWDEEESEPTEKNLEPDARVRSDEQIQSSVLGALASEPQVDASQIDVQVIKGVVLLTGNVGDENMRLTAEKRLRQIPGVREIKNQLALHPR